MCGAGLCSTLRYRLPCNESGWLDIQRTIPEDGCKHTQIPESCSWEGCQSEHHTQIPESCCWEGWQSEHHTQIPESCCWEGWQSEHHTQECNVDHSGAPALRSATLCGSLRNSVMCS